MIEESKTAEDPVRNRTGSRLGRRVVIGALIALPLITAMSCAGFNAWLNTESFAGLVNGSSSENGKSRARPVQVEWTRASMIRPGRLNVEGLRIRGNNQHVQWSVDLPQASADIDLLGLASREFRTTRLEGSGLRYLMRRRPAAGSELTEALHAPEIPGLVHEPAAPASAGPSKPPGFRFDLLGLDLDRVEEIWVDGYRIVGAGRVAGDLHFQVRGPLSIEALELVFDDATATIDLESVSSNLNLDVALNLDELMPRGRSLHEVMEAWSGNVRMSGDVADLGFLRYYLAHAGGLEVNGRGRLDASIGVDRGRILEGSTLRVDAPQLEADFPKFRYQGHGRIDGTVKPGADRDVSIGDVTIALRDLTVVGVAAKSEALESGLNISARVTNPNYLNRFPDPEVTVEIVELEIPDLSVFAGVIPEKSGIAISSGSARVDALMGFRQREAESGEIRVVGRDVVLDLNGHPLNMELEIGIPHRVSAGGTRLSIDGTQLRLATPQRPGQVEPWSANFEVRRGNLVMDSAKGAGENSWKSIRLVDGNLVLQGQLSNLDRVNEYLRHAPWLKLHGGVDLEADLNVKHRRIAPGSEVLLKADLLQADLLDWTLEGQAAVRGRVLGGVQEGHTALGVDFKRVRISRAGQSYVQGPGFHLRITGPDLGGGSIGPDFFDNLSVSMTLPQAEMIDLAVLNRYLPHSGTLAIAGGRGLLEGEAELLGEGGAAEIRLEASGASATVHGNAFVTDVSFDLDMTTDDPASGRFAVPSMTLSLGPAFGPEGQENGDPPWFGALMLKDAELTLGKPPTVSGLAHVTMVDTRPLTRLLEEKSDVLRWFDPWLTLDDVQGFGRVRVGAEGIRLDDVDLQSEEVALTGSLNLPVPIPGSPRRVEDLHVRGELKRPLSLDIGVLNGLIPREGVLQFLSGVGLLTGHIEVAGEAVVGAIDLAGENLAISLRGEPIQTNATFDIEIQTQDIESRRFDFSDTYIRFDSTRWTGDGNASATPPWWGDLVVTEGELVLGEPLEVDATVDIKLLDTGPLVHMLAETNKVVSWFQRLLEVKDVSGTAQVHMGSEGLRFESIYIEGEHLKFEGRMEFGNGTEYALFHVRLHGIGVSVELDAGTHRFTLFEPRKWYEKKLESRVQADAGP